MSNSICSFVLYTISKFAINHSDLPCLLSKSPIQYIKYMYVFCKRYVTFFGKTDTNAFPFIRQNRLQSVYIRLNGSCKRLNGLHIRLKKFASVERFSENV